MKKFLAVVISVTATACTLADNQHPKPGEYEDLHFSDSHSPNPYAYIENYVDAGNLYLSNPVDLGAAVDCERYPYTHACVQDAGTDAYHWNEADAAPEAASNASDAGAIIDSAADVVVTDAGVDAATACHNECTNGAQSKTCAEGFNVWTNGMWERCAQFTGNCTGQKCEMIQNGTGGWVQGFCVSVGN